MQIPNTPTNLKIVVISDTHGFHNLYSIPRCDILIHCGDFTEKCSKTSVELFGTWLNNQPATHKIVVVGNHEKIFQNALPESKNWLLDKAKDVHILSSDKIPVVICHEPPKGVMDLLVANRWLNPWKKFSGGNNYINEFIKENDVALVCFGHCHNSTGWLTVENTLYVNAAVVNEYHVPTKSPTTIEYNENGFQVKDTSMCSIM
ncbi:Calcineurin-like phosphoesterase domain-containing protein [Entamoeba marina]